jgi:hypothetical protein
MTKVSTRQDQQHPAYQYDNDIALCRKLFTSYPIVASATMQGQRRRNEALMFTTTSLLMSYSFAHKESCVCCVWLALEAAASLVSSPGLLAISPA